MIEKYGCIIADPPWSYHSPKAMFGKGNIQVDVSAKYGTMSVEEICALPVEDISDRNCVLALWTTNPFLADGSASAVVRAWGFDPKTVVTWAKVQADGKTPSKKTGHWWRSASEHFIFAVRGKVPRPVDWPALPTWHPGRRLPHSVKPDWLHDVMAMANPESRKLEMFARRAYPGWDSWGNQIDSVTLPGFLSEDNDPEAEALL